MGIISLNDVHLRYDQIDALRGINLEIEEGEMLSIIGPNGAGKTSVLKLLAGLLKPTSGEVLFREEPVTDSNRDTLRKEATVVFQKPVQFGTTVFKNVAYGLRIRELNESEVFRRVIEALQLVGLEDFRDRFARKLSGGEQRRVSLARAIVLNTDILLLDEPTADLDLESARIIEDVLIKINKERNTTIIVSTHNMFQAEAISHRTAIIQQGMIERIGLAREILGDEIDRLHVDGLVKNTFSGKAVLQESGSRIRHLLKVDLGNKVFIEALGSREGDVTVRFSPQDVIVSKEAIMSSARNSILGKVAEIEEINSVVFLTIDVGVEIVAQITKSSLERFEIKSGDSVYVTFKASSVIVS
ncbi:MAG: ABC transporter ATP-binding protein [Candidatus Thorarchaeota archaeon]|jgi:tungstate transport system ATP-binding protein